MAKMNSALSGIGMLALVASLSACQAATASEPNEVQADEIVYKTTPQGDLRLHLFQCGAGANRPAIVFFFGGGWVGGNPQQFFPHCRHLAALGMVAISAEYRVRNRHSTTPFECVADGKSAVRYLRAHAAELGVDPRRIVAGGGSAGGHVAACTATIAAYDEDGEDTAISSKPNALVLFNPVVDTTRLGYGANRFKGDPRQLSPVHHITSGLPPTMIFHGTADTTVPFENVARFSQKMHATGNECRLIAFEGKKHGFFNDGRDEDNRSYNETVAHMDEFLGRHGFLK